MKMNRPFRTSIEGAMLHAKARPAGLEQVHKLARNYAVSIDLGFPGVQTVNEVDHNVKIEHMSGKERYLEWVRNWKFFYAQLSDLIRLYKKQDRMEVFRLKETAQVLLNARHLGKLASWAIVQRTKRLNAV